MSTREIDIHVVVFSANRFFDERLVHDLAINDYGVAIRTERYFRGHLKPAQHKANAFLHDVAKFVVDLGSSVARYFQPTWCGHTEMVQDRSD